VSISQVKPRWKENLFPGYCGFITREWNLVGGGIDWFERFQSGFPFVHTFIISGPDEVIEAHAGTGVTRAPLSQYLGRKDCQCFIRQPIGYTEQIGQKIVDRAATHLGQKYGFGLIVADAIANTWLGHLINRCTRNIPDRFVCEFFTNKHKLICSQLVAEALQSQTYLCLRGCLRFHPDTIMPKQLGNDPQIWDPIIYRLL
jgi:hypothetical protein